MASTSTAASENPAPFSPTPREVTKARLARMDREPVASWLAWNHASIASSRFYSAWKDGMDDTAAREWLSKLKDLWGDIVSVDAEDTDTNLDGMKEMIEKDIAKVERKLAGLPEPPEPQPDPNAKPERPIVFTAEEAKKYFSMTEEEKDEMYGPVPEPPDPHWWKLAENEQPWSAERWTQELATRFTSSGAIEGYDTEQGEMFEAPCEHCKKAGQRACVRGNAAGAPRCAACIEHALKPCSRMWAIRTTQAHKRARGLFWEDDRVMTGKPVYFFGAPSHNCARSPLAYLWGGGSSSPSPSPEPEPAPAAPAKRKKLSAPSPKKKAKLAGGASSSADSTPGRSAPAPVRAPAASTSSTNAIAGPSSAVPAPAPTAAEHNVVDEVAAAQGLRADDFPALDMVRALVEKSKDNRAGAVELLQGMMQKHGDRLAEADAELKRAVEESRLITRRNTAIHAREAKAGKALAFYAGVAEKLKEQK